MSGLPVTSEQTHARLALKVLPRGTRAKGDRTSFERYRTPKWDIVPVTRLLPVPVRTVLDHGQLTPLSGTFNPCNRQGDPGHKTREPILFWFQDTPVGKELFLTLYTRPCAWGRCSFCTLPSESSLADVSSEDIYLQAILTLDSLTRDQLDEVRRVFLSNNGSILDPSTMPRNSLIRIMELMHRSCPNLAYLCVETRFETVVPDELRAFQHHFRKWHNEYRHRSDRPRCAEEPVILQISAGYETQDPYLRNAVLWKGYPEEMVQKFFQMISSVQRESGQPIELYEHVMLKPAAGMNDDEAIEEAVATIVHLERLGRHFDIRVSIRLNPTFAAVGSELYLQFEDGTYTPPTYRDVYEVLRRCKDRQVSIRVFLGLSTEGLSYSEGAFGNRDATDVYYRAAFESYNNHQDFLRLSQDILPLENRQHETGKKALLLNLLDHERSPDVCICRD